MYRWPGWRKPWKPRKPRKPIDCVAIRQGRAQVPGRPHRAVPQAGPLCASRRAGSRRLPRRRPRVPGLRGPGVGRQRGQGQQEAAHYPSPPAARHPERHGVQQAARRRHHRPGRRGTQHQPRAAPQEDRPQGRHGVQQDEGRPQLPQLGCCPRDHRHRHQGEHRRHRRQGEHRCRRVVRTLHRIGGSLSCCPVASCIYM